MGTNCAPLLADIFLYSYEAEFIQSLLSTGRKQLASRFNFTYRYIDDVLSINNPEFENYLGQMYPVELDREQHFCFLPGFASVDREGRQLHTSIYDKRDDFNFHITNFPFLSSNIPTSPAYMASLFLRLNNIPGLAPRMDVLSWGRRDFQISFSNRDASRNAWNRHWGSFMVDTGILSNNMKFPSHKCLMTFCDLTIYNDSPLLIIFCTELDILPNFEGFPLNICDGYGMPTGEAYSSEHLVLCHLGFANVLLLRPLTLNHTLHHQFMALCMIWLLTELDSFAGFDTTISCPFPWFDFLLILAWLKLGFHGASATGVAC